MRRLYFITLSFLIFTSSGIDFLYCQADQYSVLMAEELGINIKYITTDNSIYDNKVWKRELIVYFRDNYSFPAFTYTGSKDIDIDLFNKSVAAWYAENPEFAELLDLPPVYQDFQEYDISCYAPAPKYVVGGTEEQEKVYKKRFYMWMEKHPYAPFPADESKESKLRHDKEVKEFYEKYYRKQKL